MRTIYRMSFCVLIFTCPGIYGCYTECKCYTEKNSESKRSLLSVSNIYEITKEYYDFKYAGNNELSFVVFDTITIAFVASLKMQPGNKNDFLFLLRSDLNPLLLDLPPLGINLSDKV